MLIILVNKEKSGPEVLGIPAGERFHRRGTSLPTSVGKQREMIEWASPHLHFSYVTIEGILFKMQLHFEFGGNKMLLSLLGNEKTRELHQMCLG